MGSRLSPPPSFTGSGQSQGMQPPGMQNYGPQSMNSNMMGMLRNGGGQQQPMQSMFNPAIMNALRMQRQLNSNPTANPNPQPAYTPPPPAPVQAPIAPTPAPAPAAPPSVYGQVYSNPNDMG